MSLIADDEVRMLVGDYVESGRCPTLDDYTAAFEELARREAIKASSAVIKATPVQNVTRTVITSPIGQVRIHAGPAKIYGVSSIVAPSSYAGVAASFTFMGATSTVAYGGAYQAPSLKCNKRHNGDEICAYCGYGYDMCPKCGTQAVSRQSGVCQYCHRWVTSLCL